jgi:hypothetical protein
MKARFLLLVLAIGFGLFFTRAPASAQLQCGKWFPSSAGPLVPCTAYINSNVLDQTIHDHFQWQSEWCWAASISMIFQYYGHPLAQPEIVQQAYHSIENVPGTPDAIMRSLNRLWIDDNFRPFSVTARSTVVPLWRAAQDLAADHPLIIGTLGHAMVLTAVSYYTDPQGNGTTVGAIVRDPWPTNGIRRQLSPAELSNTVMLIEVQVVSV